MERYYFGEVGAFSSEIFLSNSQYFFSIKFGKNFSLTNLIYQSLSQRFKLDISISFAKVTNQKR